MNNLKAKCMSAKKFFKKQDHLTKFIGIKSITSFFRTKSHQCFNISQGDMIVSLKWKEIVTYQIMWFTFIYFFFFSNWRKNIYNKLLHNISIYFCKDTNTSQKLHYSCRIKQIHMQWALSVKVSFGN